MKSKKPWSEYTDEEIDKYRHQFVKNTLRRASFRWPWRNIPVIKARISRGIYECSACRRNVANKDKRLDHILPVVSEGLGFIGWDSYVERLLCKASGFQVLCGECHRIKTERENEQRKQIRASKRSKV